MRTARIVDVHHLLLVTDEIAVPTDGGRIVCDILALHETADTRTPVAMELKTERQLTRLVEQVTGYAALVDEHRDLFEALYSACLGRDVAFTADC